MKTPLNQLLALAAVWYLTTAGAHARTIAWSDRVNDNIYQANGTSFLGEPCMARSAQMYHICVGMTAR